MNYFEGYYDKKQRDKSDHRGRDLETAFDLLLSYFNRNIFLAII